MKHKIRSVKINDKYENGVSKHNVNTKAKNPTHSILGLNKTNGHQQVDIVLSEAEGVFIGGLSPRNKSNMIDNMIISMTSHATPTELGIVLMSSYNKIKFNKYKSLPHLLTEPICNIEDGLLYLEYLLDLIDYRELTLKRTLVRNIDSYNEMIVLENVEEFWSYKAIIVDGYERYKSKSGKVDEYIKQIAERGELVGVALVIISEESNEMIDKLVTKPYSGYPTLKTLLSYEGSKASSVTLDSAMLRASIRPTHIREFHINLIVNELSNKYPKRDVDLFRDYKTIKGGRSEFSFGLELLDESEGSEEQFVSNGFASLLKNTF